MPAHEIQPRDETCKSHPHGDSIPYFRTLLCIILGRPNEPVYQRLRRNDQHERKERMQESPLLVSQEGVDKSRACNGIYYETRYQNLNRESPWKEVGRSGVWCRTLC